MAARKAYAKSNDGFAGFLFNGTALRDFFLENVEGYQKATCAEFRAIKRKEDNSQDQWGNTVRYTNFRTFDMTIPEYWDGWWDQYDKACELGLL